MTRRGVVAVEANCWLGAGGEFGVVVENHQLVPGMGRIVTGRGGLIVGRAECCGQPEILAVIEITDYSALNDYFLRG